MKISIKKSLLLETVKKLLSQSYRYDVKYAGKDFRDGFGVQGVYIADDQQDLFNQILQKKRDIDPKDIKYSKTKLKSSAAMLDPISGQYKSISQQQLQKKIAQAKRYGHQAKRVHLYSSENVLRPRGTLQKQSLSRYVRQKLLDRYKSWTDKKYGDSLQSREAMQLIKKNLQQQVQRALKQFYNSIG